MPIVNASGGIIAAKRRPVPQRQKDNTRLNQAIVAPEIRVVDDDGGQLGVMSVSDALEIAEEKGLDLVEISGKSSPPVCKIMDYGKFKYQAQKKLHEAKKKQVVVKVKEIKMRPKTEEHDFQFKLKHARQFLEDGNKVKVTVQFRGREMAFSYLGMALLERFQQETEDVGAVEVRPKHEGRSAQMILAPQKTKQ